MSGRVQLFGFDIDSVRMDEAVGRVLKWAQASGEPCRYVVTPNADQTVQLQENVALQRAYRQASLVLADGLPVVIASRILQRPLPERVAGSDLAPALFAAANKQNGLSVFLLGAAPGVAERAGRNISRQWPKVRIAGSYSPPMGFERDAEENEKILKRIAAAKPDVLLVGLGAPKQELWVHRYADRLQTPVALCLGATIDFLAGEKRRAPLWMRRSGLEWFHRLASEPRRLIGRYTRDAWLFPQIVWNDWRRINLPLGSRPLAASLPSVE